MPTIHTADPSTAYGPILREQVIPARWYLGLELRKGQVLRIVDVEGQQVPDFICFNLDNLAEKFSPMNTVTLNGNIYLANGGVIYSDQASPMATIVADTVGRHDLIAGSCSIGTNTRRYGDRAIGKATCRGNLTLALSPYGIPMKDIPYTFNIFMNWPVAADGTYKPEAPLSKAGDYIDLRAEMNLLVAISNCPQELNPCNGFEPTDLKIVVYDA